MTFKNDEHLRMYLNNLTCIGSGSQGFCYYNQISNTVIKIFNSYEIELENDEEIFGYSEKEIMRYSDIKNNTFIWPTNVIKINDKVIGYITPYVKAKNLHKINPLKVNLDNLCAAIIEARKDIKTISSHGIFTYDMMYNTLYNGKFYIIDQDEYFYSDKKDLEKLNNNNLDYELYFFLVDYYFNKVVESNSLLNNLYKDKEEDVLIFIKQFRKYLSELTGENITHLSQAKKYIKRPENGGHLYQRI